jgi:hypothetical protein
MAFERDPDLQLKVKHLEYNSLEVYIGPIIFEEGTTKMRFKGKAFKPKTKEKSNSISCLGQVYNKIFDFRSNHIITCDETIQLVTILGIIYGPHSTTFIHYMKMQYRNEDLMKKKFDQWRYISVVTQMRSYDFMFDKL